MVPAISGTPKTIIVVIAFIAVGIISSDFLFCSDLCMTLNIYSIYAAASEFGFSIKIRIGVVPSPQSVGLGIDV